MASELAGRRIGEIDFVFIDTETTGLSPRAGGELVELAGVRARNGEITGRFQQLICPLRPIPAHVTRIHGITNGMVANAPCASDVLREFLPFAADAVWGFHNARFDMAFIAAIALASGIELPDTTIVDTLPMSRKLFPNMSHALPALAARFGVEQTRAHRALSDAETTQRLFAIFVRDNWTGAEPDFAAVNAYAGYSTVARACAALACKPEP